METGFPGLARGETTGAQFLIMDWLTTIWVAFASVSVALSGVYFVRWLRRRDLLTLLFVLLGLAVAAQTGVEVWMFRATSVDSYGQALRWMHVPVFLGFCMYVGIVQLSFPFGRLWLGVTACGLRFASLVANFAHFPNVNFAELSGIAKVTILGEAATIGLGAPYPWMVLGQLALVFLLLYLLDAALQSWRIENSVRAVAMGLAMGTLVVAGIVQGISIYWGFVEAPILAAPFSAGVALILAVDAGHRMIRADELDEELRQNRIKFERLSHAAAMSEVSGALAHEINQPLGIILSNAEAASALLDGESLDRSELREIVDDIIAADQRAADVVNRLRGILTRGDPSLRDCQLTDVVDEACSHLAREFEEEGIALVREGADALPIISADRILLVQVLMNLLGNARDAVLVNPRANRVVRLSTSTDDGNVIVTVTDNGPGLAVEPGEAFKAFVTTKPSGLGLGLAICKTIVEAHQGRIDARRGPGGGALFRVTIPRKSEV